MDQWQGLLAQCARSMGFNRGPRRAAYALAGVGLFWAVGLLGGLRILHSATSPMTTLVMLYLMLVVVALSLVIAAAAVAQLSRNAAERRRR
ncbi:MAG: hypothetical protein JWM61_3241 [Micrococcaceae bacterium]|jgi:hypothetical protein|uniref:hypothetical protein n=1 Tax=Arthrobacter cheniae TaxID=1258888 RepID=UPI0011C49CF0|nr:hypothetical protein [Arthrobacter cheniae]MCU1634589.1 hypothetical protein [Micrococcaceae bacterium]